MNEVYTTSKLQVLHHITLSECDPKDLDDTNHQNMEHTPFSEHIQAHMI